MAQSAPTSFHFSRKKFRMFPIQIPASAAPVFANAGPADVRAALDALNSTVTNFRDDFGQRLSALEGEARDRAREDILLPNGANVLTGGDAEIFARFGRTGVSAGMSTDSKPDGGYLVPTSVDSAITNLVRNGGAVRQLASNVTINADSYVKVVNLGGANAAWVSERQSRTETNGFNLSELEFPTHELSAMPPLTQKLLDDSRIDVASLLVEEIGNAFVEMEGDSFIRGEGTKKPRGFLSYPIVANASWAWGKIGYQKSGDASGFINTTASASPADCLLGLVYSLKAGYRTGARWLMNSQTAAIVRKFKDPDGRFLWTDSLVEGEPARLLGYPVAIDDFMDDVGAGKHPIAFGDWKRAYLIVDRAGIRVLRDPYSQKPYVLFYATKRVGGGIQNFDALKLLRIAA